MWVLDANWEPLKHLNGYRAGITVQKGGHTHMHTGLISGPSVCPPQWPKASSPPKAVFKATETFAHRAVCFSRKILGLFEESIYSFILKIAKITGLNP